MMKRNQRRSRGFVVVLCVGWAASPLACTDFSDRVPLPIECTVGDPYEISATIGDFEEGDNCSWFAVPDRTGSVDCDHPLSGTPLTEDVPAEGGAGAVIPVPTGLCEGPRYSQAAFACSPIPEGPRCGGSLSALHLTASHNNDWGGFFADYDIAQTTTDVSQWEGIALWARAEQATQRSVTLALDDKYTANVAGLESFCVAQDPLDTSQPGVTNVSSSGSATITTGVAGWVPDEDACGNSYEYHLTVTNDWALYLLPFEDFHQQPLPNRRIEGFDKESFRGIAIRLPKESILDLWIDDFGFYRTP